MLKAAIPFLLFLGIPSAMAAPCPNPDALGTTRILRVDPAKYPRVGKESFPETLPLAEKEIVLTFDDGPSPPTTKRILDALAHECVRATFFIVGVNATAHPSVLRRIKADGHSIGYHTQSHANLEQTDHGTAIGQINAGISSVERVLHGAATTTPSTPFFRFPYFASTPALLNLLETRKIAVFGADFWASDWNSMTPQKQLDLVVSRLKVKGKGIILFHDTKSQTAAMLPDFLRYLRTNGYRIVHIEPDTVAPAQPREKSRL